MDVRTHSAIIVNVPVIDDFLVEGNEVFNVALSLGLNAPEGARLGAATVSEVTILDNDVKPVRPTFTLRWVTNRVTSLEVRGTPNARYQLEISPDGLSWEPYKTVAMPANGDVPTFRLGPGNELMRFIRIKPGTVD